MFVGKIPCPDENYEFRMYINEKACNDVMLLPVYVMNTETRRPEPGLIGKLIFKNKDCIRTGVIAHEATHMATTYIRTVTHEKLIFGPEIDDAEEKIAYYVGWFAARIGEIFWSLK